MKEQNYIKLIVLLSVAVQAIFAMLFLANRNQELHWCALAPILGALCMLCIYGIQPED